jgi:hypothetical protein
VLRWYCIQFVALSGCRFEEAALGAPGNFWKPKACNKPTCDRKLYSRNGIRPRGRTARSSCTPPFSVKAVEVEGGRRGRRGGAGIIVPWSYLRSVDKGLPHKDVSRRRWAAPMYNGMKLVMAFMFWSIRTCKNDWYSAAEGAINHSHYQEEWTSQVSMQRSSQSDDRTLLLAHFLIYIPHLGYDVRSEATCQEWCVGHGFVLSTNGMLYHRGPLWCDAMVHCHSLAWGSTRSSMAHMFWWLRLGTKRRQRAVVLALVHCGRMSVLMESYRLQDQ